MTSNSRPERTSGQRRSLGLSLILGMALLANLGDRALSASAANSGIDPLEVLNLQIRNNALVVLDSSGSMRDATTYAVSGGNPTNFAELELVGDDPRAKMASAKQVLKKIIKNNETKVSFQFGRYAEGTSYGSPGDGTNKYLYTCSTTATAPELPCTAAAADRGFNFSGFTRATSDEHTGRLPSPPATAGTTGFFYGLYNDAYRVNRLYRVKSDNTLCASGGDTPIVSGAWVQPATPGEWNNPNATGYAGPPFIDVQRYTNLSCDSATSTTARFYFRGGEWSKGNTGGSCGGFKSLVSLADCSLNAQFNLVSPFVGPEFTPTTVNGDTVANLRAPSLQAIRSSGSTPIAETLIDIQTIFEVDKDLVTAGVQTPLWTTISTQTPVKQKTFVIFLTDGDDTCDNDTRTDLGYTNLENALRSAHKAQVLRQGIANSGGAGIVDAASKVEVFMVAFGGAVSSEINYVAWGGSGMVRPTTGALAATRWAAAPTQTDRNNCTTCRDAFPATNSDQLEAALQAAIDLGSASGEFSDQQSVTETVFEFAAVGTPPESPLDPENRYAVSVPVLLQSTFELPEYTGHLNAFRRSDNGTPADLTDDLTVQLWDAGQKLQDRLQDVTNFGGMAVGTPYLFSELYGNAANTDPVVVLGKTARIKRRIFTTTQNGVNPNYNPANLIRGDATGSANLKWTRVPLWPPTTGATSNTFVAPTTWGTNAAPIRGILDTAMGFDAFTTVAQVQTAVAGACQGSIAGDIHLDCADVTKDLARAKKEAREIVLAYIAGARLLTAGGLPLRVASGGNARELQYVVRPWVLSESTLAAPGVVTPPLLAGPKSGDLGFEEYKHYRDGLRLSTGAPVNNVKGGLGLRNPDRLDSSVSQTLKDNAAADFDLKPVMSVVYHATNFGLHAFRAGPCPTAAAGSGFGGTSLACQTPVAETGGEELWSFIPFDQLGKLPALTKTPTRANKQYLLASPVRFADIFVPGGATSNGVSFAGVWRTLLYFGRGQGGKHYTALDITTPGPFTAHSLSTEAPVVVWNRGNPDTTTGIVGGPLNNTAFDRDAYLKMGETWSVPSVGFVTAANYTTARTGSNGTSFVLFTGSGYSDNPWPEGRTFYVLDALNGDVVRQIPVENGSPAALPLPTPLPTPAPPTVLTNFLVASPVVYAQNTAPDPSYGENSPSGYRFIGNPIAVKARTVYFPDLHGRIFRFDAANPASNPVTYNTGNAFFVTNAGTDGNQPFATAVSVLQNRPDPSLPGDVLVFAESGHDRRVPLDATKPFKAYALRDPMTGGPAVVEFTRDFETNYRGVVQPAAAFAGLTLPPIPVVFFAGVRYNPPAGVNCVSSFDSILIALKGVVTIPGVPEAAFELKATGDDSFIDLAGKKINAIRVSGEGSLVIDQGLNAQNAPPPPGVPVPSETTSTSSSLVTLGLVPGSQVYKDLSSTTVPYRIGSSVCRTNY